MDSLVMSTMKLCFLQFLEIEFYTRLNSHNIIVL